jgi:hypothetical protein
MPGGFSFWNSIRPVESAKLNFTRMSATSPAPAMANLDVSSARLRANPAYELVLFDRLAESEKHLLREVAEDPDCYGVLRPREQSTLSMKAVSRDTALLLFSLREPGPLPRFAVEALGQDCAGTIGRMVLDGILEIEVNGTMISGPDASASILGTSSAPQSGSSLAAISRRAIEYAASLGLENPLELSARLYAYNCIPVTRRWRESLPEEDATADSLGLRDGPAARALARGWQALPESAAWISWRRDDGGRRQAHRSDSVVTYKLYISPACDRVREAVQATAESVAQSNAQQWKVGKGIRGLLRPDKMVVYFNQFADLQEVALKIISRLEGCPAHGVPFTAELAGAGLLSWGIDPSGDANTLAWLSGESWRGKLCDRLAAAIVQAGAHASIEANPETNSLRDAVQFALHRVRLEGIDTDTWTPAPGFVWAN